MSCPYCPNDVATDKENVSIHRVETRKAFKTTELQVFSEYRRCKAPGMQRYGLRLTCPVIKQM